MKRPLFLFFCLICLIIALLNPAAYREDPVFPLGESFDVEVSGRIAERSSQDNRLSLTLEDCLLYHAGKTYRCGRLSLTLFGEDPQSLPSVQIGHTVRAEGSLSSIDPARNPGNFSWYSYNLSRQIRYQVTADALEITGGDINFLRETLLQAQDFLCKRLELLCGEDTASASVLCALLLGDRSGLDERTETLYEEGGILHILSVSGFHVSLLGAVCLSLTRRFRLPPVPQRLLAGVLALLYWQLCGQSLSAGRAALMFLLLCLSFPAQRSYDSLSALALSAILFLLGSPALLFQAGFQLSYGAVLAIRLVCPAFARMAAPFRNRAVRKLLQSLLFGLGLQLALLPITLYHFFRYPVYGLFLNLLIIPLSSPLFVCAAAGLLLSFANLTLGRLLLIPSRVILFSFEKLCVLASSLPFSSLLGGRPALWRILLYYAVLALLCLLLNGGLRDTLCRKCSGRLCGKAFGSLLSGIRLPSLPRRFSVLLIPLALAVLLLPLPNRGLTITFLDVGQGDCAFLQAPDGTTLLIDGGSSDLSSAAEQRLIPFLEARRIDRLDYVFISHTDVDHTNAIAAFLEAGYWVGACILPALPASLSAEESYLRFQALVKSYQIPLYTFSAGDRFSQGELSLLCLAPLSPAEDQASAYASLNNASQVLLLEYQDVRVLFTGDCGEEGEELLVQELKKQGIASCHLLKAGHHGSSSSTSEALLDQLRPGAAVISCGVENRYGHPHEATLNRLAERNIPVFITSACGAVTAHIQNGRLTLAAMLP